MASASRGRRKPSSRNTTRYWRKRGQIAAIPAIPTTGGGFQGGMLTTTGMGQTNI